VYGHTASRYALAVALILIFLLFCSRAAKALSFATPFDRSGWNRTERMVVNSGKFIVSTSEDFKAGTIFKRHLKWTIWCASFFSRLLRTASRWLYGKPARRRIALTVLFRFIFNLGSLGGISILFWAFVIKFNFSPLHLPISQALLASASRAIPGIPAPSNLRFSALVQALDSLTAWMIFVLYAGPVASLFPKFQEQAVQRASSNFDRLRSARKAMHKLVEMLRSAQQLVIEHPELEKFSDNIALLRKQSDLRAFLLTQPEYIRSLLDRPWEVDFIRSLEIPIPDLQELVNELARPTDADGTTHMEGEADSDRAKALAGSATKELSQPE
jgi:hypothetical protein